MSTLTTDHLLAGWHTTGEVIAGLVNDGSALPVARAAVREAVSRHCGVRFLQVVSADVDAEARTDADAATFQAALTALRGNPRLRCIFEVVAGTPERELVERSRRAAMLVIGDDRPEAETSVAAYCRRHAICAVQVVPSAP
jgi:nucleotide-binding universal stress UspA family protein